MSDRPDMTGVLFVNDRKERDNQPDYTGRLTMNGQDWRIAGWKKTSNSGSTYLSLKISEQESPSQPHPQPRQQPQARRPALVNDGMPHKPTGGGKRIVDDEIPFGAEWR